MNADAAKTYLAQNLSNDEYNALLAQIVHEMYGANAEILDVPGVYEALAENLVFVMVQRVQAGK